MAYTPNNQEIEKNYWLRLDTFRPENTYIYNYPEVGILKVTKDSICINDFDQTMETAPILNKEEYLERNMAIPEFTSLNSDMLLKKLTFRNHDNQLTAIEHIHVRMKHTKIKNNIHLDSLTNSTYQGVINSFHNVLQFNNEIHIDCIPRITNNDILGDELRLERFKNIYFLSFYLTGKRYHVIPISEILEDSITVYGYNKNNETATLYKV